MSYVPHLRVLIVEDDSDTRANLCDILSLDGHEFDVAASARDALADRNWRAYHVILLDWRLPDASAETLLPQLRELAPDAAVIVSTGVGGIDQAIAALRHGAADYIAKPVDADLLRASLRRVGEQQRLREEKARSEAAFRTLVEAAGSLIMILSPEGYIQYMNPFGEELTGHNTNELQNRPWADVLVPAESRAAAAECLARVISGHAERGLELPILDRQGRWHWLLWNLQYVNGIAGEPAILAIGQDVTARRQADQRVLQAERLAAIGQAMTGLAHESRNALQRGQADLELLELVIAGNAEATGLVHRLQRVQQELHRLYEEVRQYAAPLNLTLDVCDLGQLAQEAWELLSQSRSGRDAALSLAGISDRMCRIDRFQMLNALRNLFENTFGACADPVRIEVNFLRQRRNELDVLIVSISDNGPGIPLEIGESAFDAFVTTKTRGTGLGLAIVRRIVEAHAGRICLGRPERGAQIILELPV